MTGQLFEDGAIRAVVTLAAPEQALQRFAHGSHCQHAALQVGNLSLCDALHVTLGTMAFLPKFQQVGDFGQAETQR